MLLSGIGPADQLKKLGVAVEVDSPEVGQNLQDHIDCGVIFGGTWPVSLYTLLKGNKQTLVGLEYMFRGTGHGRTIHLHSGARS